MKTFENLLKSEIKKAEAAANKFSGRKDCKVTAYSACLSNTNSIYGTWYDVMCEICFNYEEAAEFSVKICVYMDDRRRSFAAVVPV